MRQLITRRLGRTNRQVTTVGLGGQASIQWPAQGVDPIAIIEKAYQLGINYLDTSNIYGPSQKNFGEAFRRLKLSPSVNDYNQTAREQLFIASKTHIRTGRRPEGESFHSDFSEGMLDDFGVSTSIDDVRRSLSLLFGDGLGGYPEGAYLDSIQFHNINTMDDIDMLFEGFDAPSPDRTWIGSLAAMLDLREGTNRTGCNPKKERLVKHIGISGHWNSAAHIYAIQRDTHRIIDTLLVTINPSDCKYMGHRHNAIATAAAADMGVIGMKVFADASYYHKDIRFSNNPKDVYHGVGSPEMQSADLIQYALAVEGISTVIIGIGHIDNQAEKCQLEQNLAAAQFADALEADEMNRIEKMVVSAGKDSANAYFQRKAIGLTAPRNIGVEVDSAMPGMGYRAVRVRWDTSYAGAEPIERYEVLCNKEVIGVVPHVPQITQQPFHYDDILNEDNSKRQYSVRAVDVAGNQAESQVFEIDIF